MICDFLCLRLECKVLLEEWKGVNVHLSSLKEPFCKALSVFSRSENTRIETSVTLGEQENILLCS